MDKFRALEVFVAVAETESFTAAGHKLNLPKSTISRTIAQLEEELGVHLFSRTTRQVTLTELGRSYFEHARAIIHDMTEAEDALKNRNQSPCGTLKINAPMTFGRMVLAPLLPQFLNTYPDISIDLHLNDRKVDMIDEGYDLSIRIGQLKDSSLVARKLCPAPLVCVAAESYLRKHGIPRSVHDLQDHNVLLYRYRDNFTTVKARDNLSGTEDTLEVKGNLVANNGEVLREAVIGGAGISIQPLFIVEQALAGRHLQQILADYTFLPQPNVYAIYPPQRHMNVKTRLFIDFLADKLSTRYNSF